MTVTPIQMAQVVAATAMDGFIVQPRIVHAIRNRATGEIKELEPAPSRHMNVPPEIFVPIKEGLEAVVTTGTARRSKSSLVSMAGKTGTAQVVALRSGPEKDIPKEFRDHAWFVAYAPAEAPTIVVVVLAEHMGHGGSAAAPLAKQLLEAYVGFAQESSEDSGGTPPERNPETVIDGVVPHG